VGFINYRLPMAAIDTVVADTSAAAKAGLKKGDRIIAVNDQPVPFYIDFVRKIRSNTNKTITIKLMRGSDTLVKEVHVPAYGQIGILIPTKISNYYQVKEIRYSFLESIPAGFRKSRETLVSYWLQLKLIFS